MNEDGLFISNFQMLSPTPRRIFMANQNQFFSAHRLIIFGILLVVGFSVSEACAETSRAKRPNILMIAIDDLNDWVEPLGGHPDVKTPAMQGLASRGMTFTNAHCQAPLCNPSRTSIMTGKRSTSTGVYGLAP